MAAGGATVLGLAGRAAAAGDEYYATPDGAGTQDGSSWDNAIPGSDISSLVNDTMGAGDTLYVGSGEYDTDLSISNSGEEGTPIVIEGVDRGDGYPLFSGPWVESDEGSGQYCIRLDADVSYVELRHLNVENWKGGVLTKSGEANTGVQIEDVNVTRTFMGMFFQDLRDSTISACDVVYHERRGFRFEQGCRRIEVLDCFTDHNEGDYSWTQAWPFGFSIENGRSSEDQRDFTFKRCEARHCQQARGDQYWNGDGFTVENGHPGVEFYDCIAYANQDGGWDDKGDGTYYENCIGANNGRNFRCWDNAEYHNCLTVNAYHRGDGSGSAMGMWSDGSTELYDCTFHENDNRAAEGTLEHAEDCIFATDAPDVASGTNNVFPDDPDPRFVAPDPEYDGHPRDAYNSREYGPQIGYYIEADNTAPTAPSNLTSPSHGGNTVDLAWDAATDSGGSGLDHYAVYVDGEMEQRVNAGTTSTTVIGLASTTTYDFHVVAVDGAGNVSTASNTVTVTTDEGPTVKRTQEDPTTDERSGSDTAKGERDDPVKRQWDDAYELSLENDLVGSPSNADLDAKAYAMYDNDDLYVLVDVHDDSAPGQDSDGAWNDDSVEVYLDVHNEKESSYDEDEYQYVFRRDGSELTETKHGATEGVWWQTTEKPRGYYLEAAFPHSTTGAAAYDGNTLGFDVHVNDDDDGGDRDHKIAWHATEDVAWQDPSVFGTLTYDGDSTAPSAPSNLSSPSQGLYSVELDWDAATDEGGSGVHHYNVYVDGEKRTEVSAGTTSTNVTDLAYNTEFDFSVTAVDGDRNESPPSATITVSTDEDTEAPSAPSNLSSTGHTNSDASLDWDGSTDDGGAGLDHYAVYVDGAKDHEVPAEETSTTVMGLANSSTHDFHVTAVDGVGNESPASNSVTVTTDEGTLAVHYKFDEESGATVAEDSSGFDRDGSISSGVTTGVSGFEESAYDFDDADEGVVTDEDGNEYLNGSSEITMAAWVKSNEIHHDGGVFATEPGAESPGHPTLRYDKDGFAGGGTDVIKGGVEISTGAVDTDAEDTDVVGMETVSDMQSTEWQHLALAWKAGEEPALYVNGEEAEYSAAPSSTSEDARIAATESLRVGGDVKSDQYWEGKIDDVRVYTRRLSDSELAELGSISYDDSTAPTAPSNLTSPDHGSNSVDLEWDASSDSGGSGLDHYNVYVDGSVDHQVDADATATSVGGLSATTSYDFHVTAVDAADNESDASNTVTITTDEAPDLQTVDTTPSGDATFDLSGDPYVVDAAGASINDSTDQYGAIYKAGAIDDSSQVTTTMVSQENTGSWCKAGVMIANDITAPGSSAGDVFLAITPDHGYNVQWDADGDGYVDEDKYAGGVSYPSTLRITRDGTTFTAEYSKDGGSSWNEIKSVSLGDAAATQDVGLFVNSNNEGTKSRVEFSGFDVVDTA